MDAKQLKAARALAGWSAQDLAEHSQVGITTIRRIELGHTNANRSTMAAIQRALEAAGIEFIPENGGGSGVRWRNRRDD